jgi:hypothetical protein
MKRKIIVIEKCWDCPHYGVHFCASHCMNLSRKLKSPKGTIPNDCPLDDYKEEE